MCSLHLKALTCLTIWLGHLMSICCGHQSLSAMWSKNHCKTTRFWYWHGKIHVYQCITCTNTVLNCTYSVHYMYVNPVKFVNIYTVNIFCKFSINIFRTHTCTLFYMKIHSFTWKSKKVFSLTHDLVLLHT